MKSKISDLTLCNTMLRSDLLMSPWGSDLVLVLKPDKKQYPTRVLQTSLYENAGRSQ